MRQLIFFALAGLILIPVSLYAQDDQKKGTATITGVVLQPDDGCGKPVFDRKFGAVSIALIGSTIVLIETEHALNPKNPIYRNNYVFYGMLDFFAIGGSAGLKFCGKKWWWVAPVGFAAANGGFAVKYRVTF